MSAPVDVLAVMEELAGKAWRANDSDPILALADGARAAVAELIEAAEAALVTLGEYAVKIDGEWGYCLELEELLADGEESEYVALRDALARVKGGAA